MICLLASFDLGGRDDTDFGTCVDQEMCAGWFVSDVEKATTRQAGNTRLC